MKKLVITLALLLVSTLTFAQVSVGLGPEFNMNSRENFAAGGVFSFEYGFKDRFALGATFAVSHNFDEIMVLEPAALFRWYFLSKVHAGIFAQADAGAYLVLEGDDDMQVLFMGGLRGGIRLPLGKMYIEPYGRLGYPFAFGVGVLAGVKF